MATSLESLMQQASDGDREAASEFYSALLHASLYVPLRSQTKQLQNQASYPNDFVSVMGIQDGAVSVVPAYFREEDIVLWAGAALESKNMKLPALLTLVPEGWSVGLNFGLDIEKELSPWELDLLRQGEKSIPEIIDDLFHEEFMEPLGVREIHEDELTDLKKAMQTCASNISNVREVFIAKEEGKTLQNEVRETILIGISVETDSASELTSTKEEFEKASATFFIGGSSFRVLAAKHGSHELMLGVFSGMKPIWSKKGPILGLFRR